MKTFFVFLAILATCGFLSAGIVKYDASAMGTNIVYESFEEAPNYSNATLSSNAAFPGLNSLVLPGKTTSYTFTQSGVRLVSPIPNLEGNNLPQIMIVYATRETLNFGVYGEASADKVPDGTHYLMQYGSSAEQLPAFTIGWDYKNVNRISLKPIMYASSVSPNDVIQIDVLGGLSNDLLGSVEFPAVTAANWKDNQNVFGTDDNTPITGFSIRTKRGAVDTTRFSTPGFDNLQLNLFTPVPEPATIAGIVSIGVMGVGFLVARKFRRKKPQINSDQDYYD